MVLKTKTLVSDITLDPRAVTLVWSFERIDRIVQDRLPDRVALRAPAQESIDVEASGEERRRKLQGEKCLIK